LRSPSTFLTWESWAQAEVEALTVEDNPILAIERPERMPLWNSRRIA